MPASWPAPIVVRVGASQTRARSNQRRRPWRLQCWWTILRARRSSTTGFGSRSGLEAPAGGILHVAGPSPNAGWRVIEVFESEVHAGRFLEERFGPALEAVGFAGPAAAVLARPQLYEVSGTRRPSSFTGRSGEKCRGGGRAGGHGRLPAARRPAQQGARVAQAAVQDAERGRPAGSAGAGAWAKRGVCPFCGDFRAL